MNNMGTNINITSLYLDEISKYSILNKDKTVYRKTSKNKIEGKRSLKL